MIFKILDTALVKYIADTWSCTASEAAHAVSQMTLGETVSLTTKAVLAQAAAWAATPIGIITIFTAACYGIKKAVDALTISVEDHEKNLESLRSEYETSGSTIDQLNSKLTDTKSKITELQAKGKLSFTEEEELTNLKAENDELQRKIDLENQIESDKQKKLQSEFVTTMNSDLSESNEYASYKSRKSDVPGERDQQYVASYVDEKTHIQEQFKDYDTLLNDYKAKQEKADAETNDNRKKSLQKSADEAKKQANDTYDYLSKKVQEFQNNAKDVKYVANPSTQQDKDLNAWLDYVNNVENQFSIAKAKADNDAAEIAQSEADALKNVINRPQFSDLSKKIQTVGVQAASSDPKFKDFVQALIDSGFIADNSAKSLDKIEAGLKNVADSADGATDSTSALSDSFDKLSTAKAGVEHLAKAHTELAKTGTVAFSTLADIQKAISGVVPDADKYIEALAGIKGNAAEAYKSLDKLTVKYVEGAIGANNLTDANKNYIVSMLNEIGVTNSDAVASSMISDQKVKQKLASIDLANATQQDIDALLQEAQQMGLTGKAASDLSVAYSSAQAAMNNAVSSGAAARLGILKSELQGIKSIADAYAVLESKYTGTSGMTSSEIARHGTSSDVFGTSNDTSKILDYGKAQSAIQKIIDNFSTTPAVNYAPAKSTNTGNKSNGSTTEPYTAEIDDFYKEKEKLKEVENDIDLIKDKIDSIDNRKTTSLSQLQKDINSLNTEKLKTDVANAIESINGYYSAVADRTSKANSLSKEDRQWGNVDEYLRTPIVWNDENIAKWKKQYESWGLNKEDLGDYSTTLGSDMEVNGQTIMFTPILPDGTLLGKDTVEKYLGKVTSGGLSESSVLNLDAQGFEVDGIKIKNIIDGVAKSEDEAEARMESQHHYQADIFDNEINWYTKISDAAKDSGLSIDEWTNKNKKLSDALSIIQSGEKLTAQDLQAISDAFPELSDEINSYLDKDGLIEKNALLDKQIDLLKQQQSAMHDLNEGRRASIERNIASLKEEGFVVDYDTNANKLLIKNREHLNELNAGSVEKTNKLIKKYEDLIKKTEELNDANIEQSKKWFDVQNAIKEVKKQYDELFESEANTQKDRISLIKDSIDHEKSLLEDRKDIYDKHKTDVETLVSVIKDSIDEQKEALQGENDALDKQIDLQKKLQDLENAKNQKNKHIYREGQGFVWEADASTVSEKQADYDKTVRDNNLDAKIKALEEYEKKWQDVIDGYEKNQNKAKANKLLDQMLGYNWSSDDYWTLPESAIGDFTTYYSDQCDQLNEDVSGSVANQIKNLETLEKQWDESEYQIEQTANDYEGKLDDIKAFEKLSYDERLKYIQNFTDQAIEALNKLAEAQGKAVINAEESTHSDNVGDIDYSARIKAIENESSNYVDHDKSKGLVYDAVQELNSLESARNKKIAENNLPYPQTSIYGGTIYPTNSQGTGNSGISSTATNSSDNSHSASMSWQEDMTGAEAVQTMKDNSAKWSSASDAEKAALSAQNTELGMALGWTKNDKNGVWYTSDGSRAYSNGGVADFTGPAMLHGSSAAEMILNNADVGKVYDFIHDTSSISESILGNLNMNGFKPLSSNSMLNQSQKPSVAFSGDIYVTGVQDVDGFAKAITTQLPAKMLQELYKR